MTRIRLGIFLENGQPLTPAFGKFQHLNMEPGAKIKDIYQNAGTWTGFQISGLVYRWEHPMWILEAENVFLIEKNFYKLNLKDWSSSKNLLTVILADYQ
jgi:hypothetical protein